MTPTNPQADARIDQITASFIRDQLRRVLENELRASAAAPKGAPERE